MSSVSQMSPENDPLGEARPASEESFRFVADIAPVLIWMSDGDKRCTYVNTRWLAFTGRTLEEQLGDGWRDSIHADDLPKWLEVLGAAFGRREPFTVEYRLGRHDGEYRWVLDTGMPRLALDGSLAGYIGSCVDITERKQAEESLRRKETELREAQRLAAIGSWQWDRDTDEVVWSDELYRIAGLEPGSPAVLASNHPHLYPPEHWERIRRCADEALRSGTPYELDIEMFSNGSRKWVTARGEAQRDAEGRVSGLRGTVQDITERKRREQSFDLFRNLLDRTNDSLEIIDAATRRFLYVNDKACRELGYSREELLALTVQDINPNATEAALKEVARLCNQAGFALLESVHRRKDGSVFPVEINIKPVTLDDRRYYVSVCRDITERKQAQQALSDGEERLRLAVEAGRMFAYTWDAATDAIVRSGESSHILGIDAERPMTGQQTLDRTHPDDRNRVVAALAALTAEHPQLLISYRMNRPDDSVIWIERCSRAYFDDAGKLVRMVGMVADITPRKHAEEVLSSVSRRLLEAQEAERARIARDLHDDIGQRLALLSIALEQLQQLSSTPATDLRRSIDVLRRQASGIAADVQALSHELHSSKLQLLGVVAAIRGFCSEISARQKVEVDFSHQDVPGTLRPDIALCLFRVLQEALRNAVRHSSAVRFTVNLQATPQAISLIVRDGGCGFDPESVSQNGGLGLTSMRERLKLVAGELLIESQPGNGTTIVAQIPLAADPAAVAQGTVGV
jgi:PAS domain S-box-containing protein